MQEAAKLRKEDTKQSRDTDQDGCAYFELKAGVYYVEEVSGPDPGEEDYIPCAPFLTEVPMKDPSGDGWITDVHVYPKNQTLLIDEFVNAAGVSDPDFSGVRSAKTRPLHVGEDFGWTITSSIPNDIGEKAYEEYVVYDDLPEGITFFQDTVKVYTAEMKTTPVSQAYQLKKEVHYSADYDAGSRVLVIRLTEEGIKTAGQRSRGNHENILMLKYDCVIEEHAPMGVDLYAGARLYYEAAVQRSNAGTITIEEEVQEKPAVYTGQVEILKRDMQDKEKSLEGAVFGIASSEAEARQGAFLAEGMTDQNGRLVIKGVKYGQIGDYSHQISGDTSYWLMEKEAPKDYKKLEEPIELTLYHQFNEEDENYYIARVTVYNELEDTILQSEPEKSRPEPGKSQSGTGGGKGNVKTSDESRVIFFLAGLFFAMLSFMALNKYRKR